MSLWLSEVHAIQLEQLGRTFGTRSVLETMTLIEDAAQAWQGNMDFTVMVNHVSHQSDNVQGRTPSMETQTLVGPVTSLSVILQLTARIANFSSRIGKTS